MEKGKSKKKETKGTSAVKVTKKKTTTKKTDKSTKKKKTTKSKNTKDDNQNNENSVSVLQKENDDMKNIEDKLNQPLSKKKLPPIVLGSNENNEENNNLEAQNEQEEIREDEKKEEIIEKVDISIGTPYFYNIKGLENELVEKNKKIDEETEDQDKYKLLQISKALMTEYTKHKI